MIPREPYLNNQREPTNTERTMCLVTHSSQDTAPMILKTSGALASFCLKWRADDWNVIAATRQ